MRPNDVTVDPDTGLIDPEGGGVSLDTNPKNVMKFGGAQAVTKSLPSDLTLRPDPDRAGHFFIVPKQSNMSFETYVALIDGMN